jgi:hypothetical protein
MRNIAKFTLIISGVLVILVTLLLWIVIGTTEQFAINWWSSYSVVLIFLCSSAVLLPFIAVAGLLLTVFRGNLSSRIIAIVILIFSALLSCVSTLAFSAFSHSSIELVSEYQAPKRLFQIYHLDSGDPVPTEYHLLECRPNQFWCRDIFTIVNVTGHLDEEKVEIIPRDNSTFNIFIEDQVIAKYESNKITCNEEGAARCWFPPRK